MTYGASVYLCSSGREEAAAGLVSDRGTTGGGRRAGGLEGAASDCTATDQVTYTRTHW